MAFSNGLIVGLSALFTATTMVLFVPVAIDFVAGIRRTIQIRNKLVGGNSGSIGELLFVDLCTNGVVLCRLPARLAAKCIPFDRVVGQVLLVLSFRVNGINRRAVTESLIALSTLSALVALALTQQPLLSLAGLILPTFCLRVWTQKALRDRKIKLREQLPDALRGLGMCFMAGLSLEQAFDQTAQECREPLKRELRRMVDDLHTGSTVMESLDGLDERLAIDDMRFVSIALEIQHRTGGSMREVLDTAADCLLASFDLSRSLEVQTSQARMSARVVSILPIALVAVLSVAMEGYLATFFSSPAGLALLLCAIGMELTGIFIIRRILGINLE